MDDDNLPTPPKDASDEKETLFSFKGHDIRTGKKEAIPAKIEPAAPSNAPSRIPPAVPAPQGQKSNTPVRPTAPFMVPNPVARPTTPANTATNPPARPAPVPPKIRTLGTAPAPNAPAWTGADSSKALRTYEGDVAEALAHKGSSAASIALAESRKNSGEDRLGTTEESSSAAHAGRKIVITLVSLLLIGGGAVGAYYLYSISPLAPAKQAAPQAQAAPSLVPSDTQAVIAIDGMDPVAVIRAVRAEIAKPQGINTIKEITLVQTTNGLHYRVTGPDMANIMDIGAPDIVLRALSNDWMLGVYADSSGTKTVFVVATVDYFQNAFAGMLQWEGLMADDLKLYLYPNTPADVTTAASPIETATINPLASIENILSPAASSTKTYPTSPATTSSTIKRRSFSETGGQAGTVQASTSPTTVSSTNSAATTTTPVQPSQPYVVLRGSFVDRIIDNKDAREFITSDGTVLFLYSFIDNTKLVITGSEATLSAILNRLEQQVFVR